MSKGNKTLALRRSNGTAASEMFPGTEREWSRSTKGQVYWDLREAIIAGRLEPGQKVSESEIASRLSVSRTPAREALAALHDEGLVAIVPQLGTFVTPISEQAVVDAVFARQALECAAIRVAAERAEPPELKPLYANLEEQADAVDARDLDAFDALDEDLHRQLCDLSGHEIAWSLSRRVSGHVGRARELGMRDREVLPELLRAHQDIVDAVAQKDPDAAEALLREHLQGLLESLPEARRRHPTFFDDTSPPDD
jgi:DNA-binding GntR family transcriptional regulator